MDTDSNEANIVGTWQYTSATENGNNVPFEECDDQDFYIFSSNGSVVNNYSYGDNCEIDDTDTFMYSISGNILTYIYEGETETAEIVTLNSSTMRLKYSFEELGVEYNYVDTYTKL